MRKVAIILACLVSLSVAPVHGEVSAQNDAGDADESVKALVRTEASILDSTPIQAPAGLQEEVKDEEAVDSDS